MVNERKCQACEKWTDGSKTHCTHCGALTDPVLLAEEKRKIEQKKKHAYQLENESKASKKLRALKHSEKPIYKVIYLIANTIFTIYMAILSFLVWLIALISG